MAEMVTLDLETVDFEHAVDEVDLLIPKYLEALEGLEEAETVDEVKQNMEGVATYWKRLTLLFRQIQPLEMEIPFEEILLDTLQMELTVLEKVYLKVNLRLQMIESEWSDELFAVAHSLLARMEQVLEGLNFPQEHKDRVYVSQLNQENGEKQSKWRLRRRLQNGNTSQEL